MTYTTEELIAKFTEIFEYRDGQLFNRVGRANSEPAGKVAGWYDKSSGYFRVKVLGKGYLVHRVIYAMHFGEMPKLVDHEDKNKINNLIENLRPATRGQNVVNSLVRSDNKYGLKGVTYHKAAGKFVAQTFKDGKRIHIGVYESPVEAAHAYDLRVKELFGDFAQLNFT